MKFFKKPSENENGVALVCTLGILVLLLGLILGFATSSITEQKAASSNNQVVSARLMARSALERAVAAMRYYSTVSETFTDIISHDESRKNFDTLHKLATEVDNVTYYAWPSNYDKDSSSAIHWQYIQNWSGGTSVDTELAGRIAYIVIANTGKLDPSACVDSGIFVDSPNALNEFGAIEERPGVSVSEINLQNLDYFVSFLTGSDVQNLSSTYATPSGKLPAGERWVDMETIFANLGITDGNKKEKFREWFNVLGAPDPEAFWYDINDDGIKETGEFYHRFNLADKDSVWNDLECDSIIQTSPVSFNETTSTAYSIPWLSNWTDPGAFPSNEACQYQVTANLLDYCDSDSEVTSGYFPTPGNHQTLAPVDWTITAPGYTGLEKTPYVNELTLYLTGSVNIVYNHPKYDYTYVVDGTLGGELINMYGENFTGDAILGIDGVVSFTCYDSSTPIEQNFSSTVTFIGVELGTSKYVWKLASSSAFTVTSPTYGNINSDNSARIYDVKVRVTKALLKYDSVNVDYATPDNSSDWSLPTVLFENGSDGTFGQGYFSYEIDDPRQNLLENDWPQATASNDQANDYGEGGNVGTPNQNNSNVTVLNNSDSSYDYDTVSSQTEASTAFIRDGTMLSPWELGTIHRGAKWQTINLKKYNTYSKTTGGGSAYLDGDANILDQIKMTADTETYGKVNVNSSSPDVLTALYANIYIANTGGYSDPGEQTGHRIEAYNATDYLVERNPDGILYNNGTNGGAPFTTRAQVLAATQLIDYSPYPPLSDPVMEEIIGKSVNLTKAAGCNNFIIIALAQAIKDVGSQSDGDSVYNDGILAVNKDLDADGVIGTANEQSCNYDIDGNGAVEATAISEQISGCELGSYNQYADEIVAEQKILAVVRRDPITGKWRIVRYEYIED